MIMHLTMPAMYNKLYWYDKRLDHASNHIFHGVVKFENNNNYRICHSVTRI